MKLFSLAAIVCSIPFIMGTNVQGHGSHDEQVAECLEKLETAPNDQTMRHRLAMAYVHHGDWELALIELDKLDDLAMDSRLTRARALRLGAHYEKSQELLEAILEKSPYDSQVLLERARVFAGLKKSAESLVDYQLVLKLTPQPDAALCLEMADILTDQKLQEEALAAVQKGITSRGEDPALLMRAMEIEIATGNFDGALTRPKLLETQAPRPEPWMARRAELLAQAGRSADARAAWAALKQHISSLPNLQRGTPEFLVLSAKADAALTTH